MNNDDFHILTGSTNFSFVKHNKTDYSSYKQFQQNIDKRYSKVEKERIVKERIDNLRKWDNSLPERWRGASLSKIENPAAQEALNIIKENGKGCFFVKGDPGSGKTYISYGIIRKYIGSGLATFSEVKVISEESILGLSRTGYKGTTKFEELLDKKYKVYLFDNVGFRSDDYTAREITLWERLIDHIYNNSLISIFTSNNSAISFSKILSDSGQAKFSSLVAERVINVKGKRAPELNDWNNEDIEKIQSLKQEKEIYDSFED